MLWRGGAPRTARARGTPRGTRRRATRDPGRRRGPRKLYRAGSPLSRSGRSAAPRGESIEPRGAVTFPWRGSVTTTRYARAVESAATGRVSWLCQQDAHRMCDWKPCVCWCHGKALASDIEAGDERLCVASTRGPVTDTAGLAPQLPPAGRIAGPRVEANGSRAWLNAPWDRAVLAR